MKKCVTCEKINKSLLLILLAVVILYLINYSIFGFNYNDIFSELNINKFIFDDNSKRHRLMEGTFNYLGTIIMGTIFFLFQKFIIRKQKVKKVERSFLDKSLIHYNIESLSKQNIFYLLLMVIIWVINNYLLEIFGDILKDLDFWFLELIFLSLMLDFFFGQTIYKHHWLSMIISVSTCSILKIVTIILSFVDYKTNESDKNYKSILYVKIWYIVIIGIICFLVLILIKSLIISGIKWFIELKYVSHTVLLIIYGVMGFILSIILCTIVTYIDCNKLYNKDIVSYICHFKENEESQIYYFENAFFYFKEFKPNKLFLIIPDALTFFLYKYFYILIIKNYNPVYAIFSTPIIYTLEKLALIITTIIQQHSFFEQNKNISSNDKIKLLFDSLGDIFSLIGFIIYFEIIVFNCYGLDHNTKHNITYRSIENYKNIDKINETITGPIIDENGE